jgi:hypothetical protein
MGSNVLSVIMFVRPVVATMQVDENRQAFAEGECGLAAAVAMARLEQVPVIERCKPLAEVVNIAEHSHELQLAQRDPLLWRLIRGCPGSGALAEFEGEEVETADVITGQDGLIGGKHAAGIAGVTDEYGDGCTRC